MTLDDARPLFAEGKSVNAVSNALGITYYAAQKLKALYDEENAPPEDEAKDDPDPEQEETTGDWEITTKVPMGRVDQLINLVSHEDALAYLLQLDEQTKANAWAFFLQLHIDKLVADHDPQLALASESGAA